jgi:hypothetical protein
MRKLSFLLFILSMAFWFSSTSCQKETGENRGSGTDSTLIREIIRLDTTRARGQDTMARIFFNYDSDDRLVKVIAVGYGLTPAPGNVFEHELQYAGNDTLPKLFITKYWGDFTRYPSQPNDYRDSLFLYYTGDKIMKDSFLYHNAFTTAVITTYTELQPGHFKININEKFRSGAYYNDRGNYHVYITRQGNNYAEMKDTVPFFGGPVPRKLNLTFDSKPNPLKRVALHYPFYRNFYFDGYVSDIVPYYLTNMNENNIMSMNSWSLPSPIIFNFSFDYLNNGLPSQQRTLAVQGYNELYKYGF